MARSIIDIRNSLIQGLVDAASLVGITINPNNWSKTDYKKLILDTVATAHGIQEQLYDSCVSDTEDIALRLPPSTSKWIQYMMLNVFEYDATQVPIVQINPVTLVPYYTNPNPNFNIIKYCSVVPGILGTTLIKIAGETGGLPSQITGNALDSAQNFVTTIGVPGIVYNVVSLQADRLFMQLDVYYNGAYSAIIESSVTSAINQYLKDVSTKEFDGEISLTKLEQAIMQVEGVIDVVLLTVQARASSTTVGNGTYLIQNKTELNRKWSTVAGYIIPEDTTGANWRLTDFRTGSSGEKNLNLIAQ